MIDEPAPDSPHHPTAPVVDIPGVSAREAPEESPRHHPQSTERSPAASHALGSWLPDARTGGGQFVFSTTEMVEYLSEKAADVLQNRARQRSQKQIRNVTVGLTALGLIGFGAITGGAKWVVQSMVDTSVEQQTADLREALSTEVAYQQLVTYAFSISQEENGISRADSDRIMDLLRTVSRSETTRSRTGFAVYLEKVVDPFFAAGLNLNIDEIDKLYREQLVSYSGTVVTLVNHYGKEVIGAVEPIDKQPPERVERFQAYVNAAENNEFPELALFWRTLREFKESGAKRTPIVDELVASVNLLRDRDKPVFFVALEQFREAKNWQEITTEEGRQLENLSTALIDQYPSLQEELRSLSADPAADEEPAPSLDELMRMFGADGSDETQ